jgi:hypothetical protein
MKRSKELKIKESKIIYFVRACRKANLARNIRLTTYCKMIRSILEYAAPICQLGLVYHTT